MWRKLCLLPHNRAHSRRRTTGRSSSRRATSANRLVVCRFARHCVDSTRPHRSNPSGARLIPSSSSCAWSTQWAPDIRSMPAWFFGRAIIPDSAHGEHHCHRSIRYDPPCGLSHQASGGNQTACCCSAVQVGRQRATGHRPRGFGTTRRRAHCRCRSGRRRVRSRGRAPGRRSRPSRCKPRERVVFAPSAAFIVPFEHQESVTLNHSTPPCRSGRAARRDATAAHRGRVRSAPSPRQRTEQSYPAGS